MFDEGRMQASFWPVGVSIPVQEYEENLDIPVRTPKWAPPA